MKLSEWTAEHGRKTELARAIDAGPGGAQLVYQWAKGVRPIPIDRCVQIERATGGEVRRWDLRPEDWHRYWPELIGAEGAPDVPQPAEVRDAA